MIDPIMFKEKKGSWVQILGESSIDEEYLFQDQVDEHP
jgi:hypothetical protein